MKLRLSLRLAVGLVTIMLPLTGGCLHCGWWLVTNQHNINYTTHTYRNSHSASRWFVLHIFFRGVSKSVKRMSCALIDDPTCPSLHTTLYLHPDKYLIVAATRDILSTLATTTTAQSHVATLSGVGLAVEQSFTVPGKGPYKAFLLVESI